jgi:hypothetical protein
MMGSQERQREKPNQLKKQKVKSLEFFKPTLATALAIVLAWLLSVRPNAYSDAESESDRDTGSFADTDSFANSDARSFSNANADSYSNSYPRSHRHSHVNKVNERVKGIEPSCPA